MDGAPQVCVLLPCLNEQQALPGLLAQLDMLAPKLQPHWQLSALVVDDGSTDGTAEVARRACGQLQVELVQHARNMGLGAALATGMRHFVESGDPRQRQPNDALAVMDADGTHPPALLAAMLPLLSQYDVVSASRYARGGAEHGLSARRRLYSKLASVGMGMICPVRGARDYSCGYRVYSRGILENAVSHYGERLVTERGFTCMAELLCKLARRGARCAEVPLELHYELKAGASKMNVPATIRRYVVLAARLLFDPRFR